MRHRTLLALASAFAFPVLLAAQDNLVINAMSAGPLSVSFDASIRTWDGKIIREGSNGWTCIPDP